jgi:hypothetical protein
VGGDIRQHRHYLVGARTFRINTSTAVGLSGQLSAPGQQAALDGLRLALSTVASYRKPASGATEKGAFFRAGLVAGETCMIAPNTAEPDAAAAG